jgi:transposase-like protein
MPEQKTVCPQCGSELVHEISNMKRCVACGHQFNLVKNPIAERARLARENAVGFALRVDSKQSHAASDRTAP